MLKLKMGIGKTIVVSKSYQGRLCDYWQISAHCPRNHYIETADSHLQCVLFKENKESTRLLVGTPIRCFGSLWHLIGWQTKFRPVPSLPNKQWDLHTAADFHIVKTR